MELCHLPTVTAVPCTRGNFLISLAVIITDLDAVGSDSSIPTTGSWKHTQSGYRLTLSKSDIDPEIFTSITAPFAVPDRTCSLIQYSGCRSFTSGRCLFTSCCSSHAFLGRIFRHIGEWVVSKDIGSESLKIKTIRSTGIFICTSCPCPFHLKPVLSRVIGIRFSGKFFFTFSDPFLPTHFIVIVGQTGPLTVGIIDQSTADCLVVTSPCGDQTAGIQFVKFFCKIIGIFCQFLCTVDPCTDKKFFLCSGYFFYHINNRKEFIGKGTKFFRITRAGTVLQLIIVCKEQLGCFFQFFLIIINNSISPCRSCTDIQSRSGIYNRLRSTLSFHIVCRIVYGVVQYFHCLISGVTVCTVTSCYIIFKPFIKIDLL